MSTETCPNCPDPISWHMDFGGWCRASFRDPKSLTGYRLACDCPGMYAEVSK